MKRKIFFLCTLLALGVGAYANENNNQHFYVETTDSIGSYKKGKLDKLKIPVDGPVQKDDCPYCALGRNRNPYFNGNYCTYCYTPAFDNPTKMVECNYCGAHITLPVSANVDEIICECGIQLNTTVVSLNAYYSYNGVSSPLIGCLAELKKYNGNNGFDVVCATYSDSNGSIKFVLGPANYSAMDSGLYKIRLYPGDGNLEVCTNIGFDWSSGFKSFWKSQAHMTTSADLYACADTDTFSIYPGCGNKCNDMNIQINSSNPYNDSFGMCFYVGQAGLRAKEFATNMLGYTPKKATILYDGNDDCSNYDDGILHIVNDAWNSMFDAVMHEYGHHLQEELKNCKSIVSGSHNPGNPVNKEFAWMEAWPSVFAKVAQNYTSINKKPKFTLNYVYGGYTLGEDAFNGDKKYDLGSNDHNNTGGRGEEIEEAVQEILWDIFDYKEDGEEYFDSVNLGYEYWFFITTRENTFTIKNLYDNLIHFYPQFESHVKELFEYHGITY